MKHQDAIDSDAVARYLLRQMPEDEQEIFEEHFFYCSICAADVTDGTRMMIAGRDIVYPPMPKPIPKPKPIPIPIPIPKPFWWNLQVAAAASLILPLFGGGIGYRLAIIQQQHIPTQLVQVVALDTGISRAGTPAEIPVVRPGDDLRFDVVPNDDAVGYAAVITCGGKTESTHGISRKMAADAVTLRLGELPAGRCELVVQGVRKDGKRFWITSSPFEVGER
jgi:hypothetical protein